MIRNPVNMTGGEVHQQIRLMEDTDLANHFGVQNVTVRRWKNGKAFDLPEKVFRAFRAGELNSYLLNPEDMPAETLKISVSHQTVYVLLIEGKVIGTYSTVRSALHTLETRSEFDYIDLDELAVVGDYVYNRCDIDHGLYTPTSVAIGQIVKTEMFVNTNEVDPTLDD